ncbi:MAG: hypothetical protein J6K32_06510 [Clostridia bacterium]|nr:hypothetical protein [Clostridia bacterium]
MAKATSNTQKTGVAQLFFVCSVQITSFQLSVPPRTDGAFVSPALADILPTAAALRPVLRTVHSACNAPFPLPRAAFTAPSSAPPLASLFSIGPLPDGFLFLRTDIPLHRKYRKRSH